MSEEQRLRLLEMIRAASASPPESLEAGRQKYEDIGKIIAVPSTASLAADRLGGVDVEIGRYAGTVDNRHLLYFHGGGYTIGSIASHRGLVALLGQAARARTISVGYRLAPEHLYPAALDDGLAVYRALLSGGVPADHIAMAGDSAGCALFAALLLAARDEGLPMPAAAVMFSPLLDMTGDAPAYRDRAESDAMITRDALIAARGVFLGDQSPTDASVSPVFGDLRGFPPLYVQVGPSEVLIDDALAFARAAMIADVEVRLDTWPRQQHVWQLYASILDEGAQSIERAGRFLAGKFPSDSQGV